MVLQNYFTVINLYKRALLTLQSPSTKPGKQVITELVPTLTTTPPPKNPRNIINQMVLKLSDPSLPSSQGRYAGEEGVNPSSALPLA